MPVVAGPEPRRLVAEREVLYIVFGQGFPDGRREGGGGHPQLSRRRVSCRVDAVSCRPNKEVQGRGCTRAGRSRFAASAGFADPLATRRLLCERETQASGPSRNNCPQNRGLAFQ